ncbi:hypothetical protein K8B83_05380 [Shewanella inventionis]|uniref:Pentapeptide repeat-containing protein n=1 Tax=Shewanella inventionis TaxID=1738770 RepID=A0ABQ1INC6_9GAMM|nr:hypothetical protein [Shewanella inventionis]MCL1156587.1 hypothetical protein [Shewanella inventionis]UAL44279.1 hypothetical protein K8B83_05380 [Shewanella inventionis]GGB46648.1 hypothetical protein GCM10011607_03540 [Shewanella inventionis]
MAIKGHVNDNIRTFSEIAGLDNVSLGNASLEIAGLEITGLDNVSLEIAGLEMTLYCLHRQYYW